LPHLDLVLSWLTSIFWSFKPLPHVPHTLQFLSLFYSSLWTLTLSQFWLIQLQPFYQPTCLILTLQSCAILLAQLIFQTSLTNSEHNTLQQSSPLIRQTITHHNLLITSLFTQNIFPLQGLVIAALNFLTLGSQASCLVLSIAELNHWVAVFLCLLLILLWDYGRSLLCANSPPSTLPGSSLMPREKTRWLAIVTTS